MSGGRIDHMDRALRAAEKGRGRTSPNPMVGCVIAKGARVIATGHHPQVGAAHAEVEALRRAGRRARGADVYVNLEPCAHHGRTGPCTEALIAAGVKRVFVGTRDPNPLVNGRGIRKLRRAGIAVDIGLLGAEARRLNEAFEHVMRHGRPFVVAKVAQSLDGRVATRTGQSQWITGEPARRRGHELRGDLDAIVVGVGTVRADDPRLTCRVRGGSDPVRIIVDSQARTPPTAKVVRASRRSAAGTWIVVGNKAPARRRAALERAGAETISCKMRGGRIDLSAMLEIIRERELLSVLVEGGPTMLGGFFDAALVDKLHAFVAPRIIGGVEALGSVGALGIADLKRGARLEHLAIERLGADLHLTAYVAQRS